MKLTQQQLEAHLLGAANILRGRTAGQDYKNYILSLMFYKRLCDQWEHEAEDAIKELEAQQGKTFTDAQRAVFRARGELLALGWGEVNLGQSRLTVLSSKTEAGAGREIDIWPELHDVLVSYKAVARHAKPSDYVFATATGKADTRSNVARRLKRVVLRANEALGAEGVALIPTQLSPHSLRRTFASLLYLRGENPVYVMNQMGHADPKLALRIYARVTGEQRRRRQGARLLGVLDGPHWTRLDSEAQSGTGAA